MNGEASICNQQLATRAKKKLCDPDDLLDLRPSVVTEWRAESVS